MKHFLYLFFFLFSINLYGQSSDSVEDGVEAVYEIRKSKLAEELQDGLAKLRVGENQPNPEIKLEACEELAQLYAREKYFEKELVYLQQAISIVNELGNNEKRLAIQSLIAQSHFNNGQWDEAYSHSEEIFDQHQVQGAYQPAIQDLEQMAESAIQIGNYVKAKEQYERITQIAHAVGDPSVEMTAINNMGFAAAHLENYQEAAYFFEQAETKAAEHGHITPGHVHTNLGIAWNNLGSKDKALVHLHKAEKQDAERKCYIQHLISSIYLTTNDIYNALNYNELAIESARKTKNDHVMADAYGMASEIYQQLYEHDKALDFYKKHLSIQDSLERVGLSEQKEMENIHAFLDDTENSLRQSMIESELKQATLEQAEQENKVRRLELEKEKQELEKQRQQQQIAFLEKEQEAKEATVKAARLEADRTRQELALATQTNLALQRAKQIEAIKQRQQLDSLEAAKLAQEQQQRFELMQKEQEAALKEKEQQEFRQQMYTLTGLGALITVIVFGSWLYGRKLNRELAARNSKIESQNEEIISERNRAEGLLLNILPAAIAHELKEKGAATPKHYDAVSVLFTDFEGFTAITAAMPPTEVIKELNECFMKFDEIAEKYKLEKIKTIGDSYMCAGGLPVKNSTHPTDAVNAGMEMLEFIEIRNQRLIAQGRSKWPIRIGIHTGELVAGVVGSKKFAYDIWGDTVNVASRMETNSGSGQINISEATYKLVNKQFDCKFRGKIEVKNKGKMGMYIVGG